MKLKYGGLLLILFGASLLFLPASQSFAAKAPVSEEEALEIRIKREEKRLESIQKQIEFHKKQMAATEKRQKGVFNDLTKLTQELGEAETNLAILENREVQAKKELRDLNERIMQAEGWLRKIKGALRQRLIAIYKYGGMVEIDMLLSANTTHDAMTAAYMLNRMTVQDQQLFATALKKKKELDSAATVVQRQKDKVLAQQRGVAQQRSKLNQSVNARNDFLQTLRAQKGKHQEMAKALAQEEAEIEAKISSLIAERQKFAKVKRQEEETRTGQKDTLLTGASGPFAVPVQGSISSPFGMRVHPIFKTRSMHTGVDIQASHGTPVVAAANGEVLYAGWLRGYGQVVILDHGRDISTVYAHLSRMHVDEGQRVKKGQTIGNIGSTGVSTGPHLHFEVRVSGVAKEPMSYLRRR